MQRWVRISILTNSTQIYEFISYIKSKLKVFDHHRCLNVTIKPVFGAVEFCCASMVLIVWGLSQSNLYNGNISAQHNKGVYEICDKQGFVLKSQIFV